MKRQKEKESHIVSNLLQEKLLLEVQRLEIIIDEAERFIAHAPEGHLRILQKGTINSYYLRDDPKDNSGHYIKKSNMNLIRQLAQKEYAKKIVRVADGNKRAIERFLSTYRFDGIEQVYDKLSLPRKQLIMPYIIPDEEFIAQWQQEKYPVKNQKLEEDTGIYTEKGEAVRSKSEKILADKFNLLNIPYHYEKPLYLEGYGYVHPDFTVLNKRTRKEYY